MGIKRSWIAVKEENYAKIHHILGLSDMTQLGIPRENQWEEYVEVSGYRERIEGFATEKGWYFINSRHLPSFIEEKLSQISMDTTVVMFWLNETVMCSTVEYWHNSKISWSVSHGNNAESGVFHLEEKGILPDCVKSIKEAVFSEQNAAGGVNAGVDMVIEVPSLVAREVIGYKYDEGFTNGDQVIESTESVLSRKSQSMLLKNFWSSHE